MQRNRTSPVSGSMMSVERILPTTSASLAVMRVIEASDIFFSRILLIFLPFLTITSSDASRMSSGAFSPRRELSTAIKN